MFPFKIQQKNKLQPADLVKCQLLLRHRKHAIQFVTCDKAQFRLNGKVCTQNVRCYAPGDNAHANFVYETYNNDRKSMGAWAGVIDNNIIGTFFYVGHLNIGDNNSGHTLPTVAWIPTSKTWFAFHTRCHTTRQSRVFLEQHFPGKVVNHVNAVE